MISVTGADAVKGSHSGSRAVLSCTPEVLIWQFSERRQHPVHFE